MEHNLQLFSKIAEYLSFLTTYDSLQKSRSKGLGTYEELADELNQIGLLPNSGKRWTPHVLECFFSRCRKNHSISQLKEHVELYFIDQQTCFPPPYLSKPIEEPFVDRPPSLAAAKNEERDAFSTLWKKHENADLEYEKRAFNRKLRHKKQNQKILLELERL